MAIRPAARREGGREGGRERGREEGGRERWREKKLKEAQQQREKFYRFIGCHAPVYFPI